MDRGRQLRLASLGSDGRRVGVSRLALNRKVIFRKGIDYACVPELD